MRRWELVVRLVQVMFRDGAVPYKIAWATMVIIPKVEGGYRVIGLVEVFGKLCSVVVSCCLKRSIVLHDALCGFRKG